MLVTDSGEAKNQGQSKTRRKTSANKGLQLSDTMRLSDAPVAQLDRASAF